MKLKTYFIKLYSRTFVKAQYWKCIWQCACVRVREICVCWCRNELGLSTHSLALDVHFKLVQLQSFCWTKSWVRFRGPHQAFHIVGRAGAGREAAKEAARAGNRDQGLGARSPPRAMPRHRGAASLGRGGAGRRGCTAAFWHLVWAVEVTPGAHNGKALFVCQRKARSWTTAAGRLCLCLKVSAGEPARPSDQCSWAAACTCRCGLYQASQRLAGILGRQGPSPRLGLMGLLMLFVWSAKRCSGGWWFFPPCWVWKLQNWVAQMLGRVA